MRLTANLVWDEVLRGGGYTLEEVPDDLRGAVESMADSMFQPLRDAFGGPLLVISGGGLRSVEVNRQCGGSRRKTDDQGNVIPGTGSRHLYGQALDLKAKTPEGTVRLYDLAIQLQADGTLPQGGCALYITTAAAPRFVHVDCRGTKARWNAGTRAKVVV